MHQGSGRRGRGACSPAPAADDRADTVTGGGDACACGRDLAGAPARRQRAGYPGAAERRAGGRDRGRTGAARALELANGRFRATSPAPPGRACCRAARACGPTSSTTITGRSAARSESPTARKCPRSPLSTAASSYPEGPPTKTARTSSARPSATRRSATYWRVDWNTLASRRRADRRVDVQHRSRDAGRGSAWPANAGAELGRASSTR